MGGLDNFSINIVICHECIIKQQPIVYEYNEKAMKSCIYFSTLFKVILLMLEQNNT